MLVQVLVIVTFRIAEIIVCLFVCFAFFLEMKTSKILRCLTHVHPTNNTARMVDISDKTVTKRIAKAQAEVRIPPGVFGRLVTQSTNSSNPDAPIEILSAKGPVFATAVVSGVMAAKNTSNTIPFCHPLPIDRCDISFEVIPSDFLIRILCTTSATHKTGVEMEALVGASTAALCVYDMLKALSHDIIISNVMLLAKAGGKSDFSRQ